MTTTPPIPTAPPLEWIFSRRSRERAEKWMQALLPALERWNHPGITHAELERGAVEAAERILGEPFSARHVRRLIALAIERDAGRQQWNRIELFLEKNAAPAPIPDALRSVENFDGLLDAMNGFATPGQPTASEEAAFLLAAWRVEQALLLRGLKPKKARAELNRFLWERARCLSESQGGLTSKIARKFRAFHGSGGNVNTLLDGRAARAGGKRAPEIPQDFKDRLVWTAAKRGGRVAQAIDDLLAESEQQGLPAEFVEWLITMRGPGSKVNRRLLADVLPEVEMLQPYFLGKKAIDDATAPLRRTYDKLRSMSVVTADDFTLNAYFSVPDGNGWFTLTRGQVLLFIDVRSRKIIGRALIPERNYDSLSIRTGMNIVCRDHGIPGVWYFELGSWKRSHVVKGTAPKDWRLAHSGAEFQFGWENLGARFIHARRARSKPAELVGGLLQNLMDGCRGACGRDERHDLPEATKRAKLAVEARREHPDKFFDTFDQWEQRLDGFIDRYNTRPQGGLLAGKSPDEVFAEQWPHHDLTRLDANTWHLGAHYVREFTVGNGGIAFRLGKHEFAYFDESLSDLRGRQVLGWFDPEMPDFLAVTDMSKQNPRLVARHTPVDFLAALQPHDSAEAEHYRRELAKQQGFNAHPKARFKALKAKFGGKEFVPTFRTIVPDRRTAALGVALTAQRAQAVEQLAEDTRRRARILRLCRETNTPPDTLHDFSEVTEQALRRFAQRRRKLMSQLE